MKAIIILYDGVTPSPADIKNGVTSLGILLEDAQVKTLSESETSSVIKASTLLSKAFVPTEDSQENNDADYAADVIVRVTEGTNPADIAKKVIPMIIQVKGDNVDDTTTEFLKACRVLSSGKKVSNGWLAEHGLTRLQWNTAKQFIADLID